MSLITKNDLTVTNDVAMTPKNEEKRISVDGSGGGGGESSLFDSVRKRVQQIHRATQPPDSGRQFWMPDSRAKQCYDCGSTFNALRRRHHCRVCGQIFCHRCSSQTIEAKVYKQVTGIETSGVVRVCRYCYRVTMRIETQETSLNEPISTAEKNPVKSLSSATSNDGDKENQLDMTTPSLTPISGGIGNNNSSQNNWSYFRNIGRRLSYSTSFGEIVRSGLNVASSTSTPIERLNLHRPGSAASTFEQNRRSSLANLKSRLVSNSIISSSSFDNLCSLISEVDNTMDSDASKPSWVKEILEESKHKQGKHEKDIASDEDIDDNDAQEEDEDEDRYSNIDYNDEGNFKADEDEELNGKEYCELGSNKNIQLFKGESGQAVIRYSPKHQTSSGDNQQPGRGKSPRIKKSSSAENSCLVDSFKEIVHESDSLSTSCDLLSDLLPRDKALLDEQFMCSTKFDDSDQHAKTRLETDTLEDGDFVLDKSVNDNEFFQDSSSSGGRSSDLSHALIDAIYEQHTNRILQQILIDEKLSTKWAPIINDLAKRIATTVTLGHHSYLSNIDNYYVDNVELRQGLRRNTITSLRCGNTYYPMDIRQRVKIKTIPNGQKSECQIINGVVFTKNVAHRKMRTAIDNARILLFACSIGYDERKRSLATTTSTSAVLKLTSFDSMRLQEPNYIANLVAKIASVQPDVIFVQGSVSQTALDLLHHKYGITVVLNVKRTILERIALFTGSQQNHSPEMVNTTRVGKCGRFRLQKFSISKHIKPCSGNNSEGEVAAATARKTLMFVEGCPTNVCCSVILRGDSRYSQCRQVKCILGYMVYVHYHMRLEKAFHSALHCLPIEQDNYKSMTEMYKNITRVRQRINSSRSQMTQLTEMDEVKNSALGEKSEDQEKLSITCSDEKLPMSSVKLTTISDNSDPLRSAFNNKTADGGSSSQSERTSPEPSRPSRLTTMQLSDILYDKFDLLLAALPLSISPYIDFPVPFLMTKSIYAQSSLRHYYPPNLLASERLIRLTTSEIELLNGTSKNNDFYDRDFKESSFEKDEDYYNYIYLSQHYALVKQCYPALADAVNQKEEAKLSSLKILLTMRYMVSKSHPLFLNTQIDYHQPNSRNLVSRVLVADFRACGPYLRCMPTIMPKPVRHPSNGKQANNGSTVTRQPLKFSLEDFYADSNEHQTTTNSITGTSTTTESLSSIDQQCISVLFSVFSPHSKNAPNYCFKPRIIDISYYGRNDMSLGAFLLRHFFFLRTRFNQPPVNQQQQANSPSPTDAMEFFFTTPSNGNNSESGGNENSNSSNSTAAATVSRRIFCSSETCNASMFRHFVRFSHFKGTITILLNKIHDSRHVTMPHKMLTWSFCVHCRAKSSYAEMSPDALALSFGKFLELKFYGDRYYSYSKYFGNDIPDSQCCRHSLHKAAYQFFSYDQLVVSFKYDPIVLYEVVTPSPIISITRNQFSKAELINYLQDLTVKGHEVYSKINDEIDKIKVYLVNKNNTSTPTMLASLALDATTDLPLMDAWIAQLRREEQNFVQDIKEVHIRVSSPNLNITSVVELFRMQNAVIGAKKMIIETVATWNDRINEFFSSRRRNPDKLITSLMNRLLPLDSNGKNQSVDTMSNKSEDLEKSEDGDRLLASTPATESLSASTETLNDGPATASEIELSSSLTNRDTNEVTGAIVIPKQVQPTANKLSTITSKVISKVTKVGSSNSSGENAESTSFAARFLNSSRNTDQENHVNIMNPFDTAAKQQSQQQQSQQQQQYCQMFEHFHLPTFKDLSIMVRDKDIGSIIAYSLTTDEYERKLAELCAKQQKYLSMDATKDNNEQTSEVDGNTVNVPKNETSNDTPATTLNSKQMMSELNQHVDVQYNDSYAKFYCCVYFAEQFRRLRSMLLIDGGESNRDTVRRLMPSSSIASDQYQQNSMHAEDLYIYSLASCIPWNAIGGKSGSTFSKTQNHRFILKEISKGELNHFLTFVTDYIAYCERALCEKNPSAFVKIIGLYQISYKNTTTGKASIHHILVMENLFYECNISFIYDLKGSMRNRKVEISQPVVNTNSNQINDDGVSTNGSNETEDRQNLHGEAKLYQSSHTQTSTVLMDENLRQISTLYPLYVHEHSKRLLMEAIYRDSEFLRSHGVMDYSLLVGFDEQFSEYVVGIIDYVRLFNWEKEIEFRVKKLGKTIDPTIVHPAQYQKRFLDAINDYFIEVPDKWHSFMRLTPLAGNQISDKLGSSVPIFDYQDKCNEANEAVVGVTNNIDD